MQKFLICLFSCAYLLTAGCSTMSDIASALPKAMGRTSLMYIPDVQQGNVLQQSDINRLQPGMSKNQVRFIMGTPMLVDLFHLERWDYLYLLNEHAGELEQRRVTLFFNDDQLVRIAGDLRPNSETEEKPDEKEAVFDVPDYIDPNKGLITRALEMLRIKSTGD